MLGTVLGTLDLVVTKTLIPAFNEVITVHVRAVK